MKAIKVSLVLSLLVQAGVALAQQRVDYSKLNTRQNLKMARITLKDGAYMFPDKGNPCYLQIDHVSARQLYVQSLAKKGLNNMLDRDCEGNDLRMIFQNTSVNPNLYILFNDDGKPSQVFEVIGESEIVYGGVNRMKRDESAVYNQ